MARFHYTARQQDGRRRSGALEAPTLEAARRALKAQGLLPEAIRTAKTARRASGRVPAAAVTAFLEDLAGLLQSGATVDRALSLIASQSEAPRMAEAARDMAAMVHKGKSLSEALEGYADYVGRLTHTLVRAAEAGGAVDVALADIVRQRRDEAAYKKALLSSLFYPTLLICMSLVSLGVLTNYVAPQFVLVFEEFDKPLPDSLALLMAVGQLGEQLLLIAPPLGILLWWLLCRWSGREQLRKRLDSLLLSLPLAKSLSLSLELSRYFRTMGLVLGGGVSLARALPLCHEVLGNRQLRRRFLQLQHDVRGGQPLHVFFQQDTLFPRRVAARLRMAEEQGDLPGVCLDLGTRLGDSARSTLSRLTGMLEPAVILVTGILVGGAVFGMFQAVFSLTELEF